MFGVTRSTFSERAKVWIEAGQLHQIQIHPSERIYYPRWELEDLLRAATVKDSLPDLVYTAAA